MANTSQYLDSRNCYTFALPCRAKARADLLSSFSILVYSSSLPLMLSRSLSFAVNKQSFSSMAAPVRSKEPTNKLDPWFITGLVDGEGCFIVSITNNPKYKSGYNVRLWFSIGLNEKDKVLLENMHSYFGVGKIYKHTQDTYSYRVQSVKDLQGIIVHFDKYPLITQKRADYLLFKQILELVQKKEHLTEAGLREIVAIKASLNLGLSDQLNNVFPNLKPVLRPLVEDQKVPHEQWLAGFICGEGCFFL